MSNPEEKPNEPQEKPAEPEAAGRQAEPNTTVPHDIDGATTVTPDDA